MRLCSGVNQISAWVGIFDTQSDPLVKEFLKLDPKKIEWFSSPLQRTYQTNALFKTAYDGQRNYTDPPNGNLYILPSLRECSTGKDARKWKLLSKSKVSVGVRIKCYGWVPKNEGGNVVRKQIKEGRTGGECADELREFAEKCADVS